MPLMLAILIFVYIYKIVLPSLIPDLTPSEDFRAFDNTLVLRGGCNGLLIGLIGAEFSDRYVVSYTYM